MAVTVIGAGNFGTVIASLVAENGNETHLWLRDQAQLADIIEHRENRRYLPGYKLLDNIKPTGDMSGALKDSDLVFVTVPSSSFRAVSREVAKYVGSKTYLVTGTKGIEIESFSLMSQILKEECQSNQVGVLSGPNLAEEIAQGRYAGTVIASDNEDLVAKVQLTLQNGRFRVYGSDDMYGVELGGALKNIYAIICGMASAINVGQNALAMVVTRSLAEMCRIAETLGANPYTFLGLSGIGDLIATCSSRDSRNFQLGYRIASGQSLEEANNDLGKLAEGVNTLQAVYRKKDEMGLYMPLVDALYRVLFCNENIQEVIVDLMTSENRPDVDVARTSMVSK